MHQLGDRHPVLEISANLVGNCFASNSHDLVSFCVRDLLDTFHEFQQLSIGVAVKIRLKMTLTRLDT